MSTGHRIEQFIQRHRGAMDAAVPSPHVWEAIERSLDRWPQASPIERFIDTHRPLFDAAAPEARTWMSMAANLSAPRESLENVIGQHHSASDECTPDPRVWQRLSRQLPSKPSLRVSGLRYLCRVAAAAALVLLGVAIGRWYDHIGLQPPEVLSLSQVSPEYAELEAYFQREIQARKTRLSHLATYGQATIWEDLQQMDVAMAELQVELARVPMANREAVVRAMIENYKARLAILERVLQYLERQHLQPANSTSIYEDQKI